MRYPIKLFFLLLILSTLTTPVISQSTEKKGLIEWYSLEDAMELRKTSMRPLFIDVYTEWCGWCKKMMNTTFSDKEIAGYINSRFYPVRLDAETQDTITFRGKDFINNESGRRPTHDLAKKLLNNKLTYPTVVIMDKQGKTYPIPGYIKPKEGMPIAAFFAEGNHKVLQFQDFRKQFNKLPQDQKQTNDTLVNWLSLKKAMKRNRENPKGIFLHYYVDWNISSRLMQESTFSTPAIARLINKNYYPVKINATTRDTLTFGRDYVNKGNAPSYHQLPAAMLQGKMEFPAILFLNKKAKLLQTTQYFMTPDMLEPLLVYFGNSAYKNQKWADFRKTYQSTR